MIAYSNIDTKQQILIVLFKKQFTPRDRTGSNICFALLTLIQISGLVLDCLSLAPLVRDGIE